eukprot:CCRYP_007880-RC/>CCRYP_007880-RC protein AED:0.10 eAED:0.12 QI:222/0.5/0.6/1/0.5/0.6/5/0/393
MQDGGSADDAPMSDATASNIVGTGSSPPAWVEAVAAASKGEASVVDSATVKRKAIQSIMRDTSLTDLEKRLRIQRLMDGSSASNGDLQGGRSGKAKVAGIDLLPTGLENVAANGVAGIASATGGGEHGEVMACVHYQRKNNVVSPCCNKVFGCRVCHDEISVSCGPMDRFAIKEIVCKECNTRQSSSTNVCLSCGVTFAEWHCPKCNLWMDLSKRPFHCDKCGICRVGGQENFRHCDQCCMCISNAVYETHNCIKTSTKAIVQCVARTCFLLDRARRTCHAGMLFIVGIRFLTRMLIYRRIALETWLALTIAVRSKTIMSRTSMAAAWQARARDIEMQPMPEDLARIVNIMCNDCEKKSANCSWHFLGVQCPECRSFNTVVEQIVTGTRPSTA